MVLTRVLRGFLTSRRVKSFTLGEAGSTRTSLDERDFITTREAGSTRVNKQFCAIFSCARVQNFIFKFIAVPGRP